MTRRFFLSSIRLICLLGLSGLSVAHSQMTQGQVVTFEEAINLSLRSPDVEAAQASLELERLNVSSAAAPLSGSVSTGYSQSWDSAAETRGSLDSVELSASLNVIPYGPNYEALQGARRGLVQSERALSAAKASSLLKVTETYLNVLRSQEEGRLKARAVALAKDKRTVIQERQAVGAVNDAQVLEADLEVNEVENALATLMRNRTKALKDLSLALGVAVTQVAGGPPAGDAVSLPVDVAKQLAEREDIWGAQAALEDARVSLTGTRRGLFPSGSLSMGYQMRSGATQLRLGTSIDTSSFQPSVSTNLGANAQASEARQSGFSLSVGLTVPLDAGAPAKLRAAELSLAQAEAQLERSFEGAQLEVDTSLNALRAAESSFKLSARLLAQSVQSTQATRARFDLGLVSVFDVRQAELAAAEARLGHARAKDSVLLARLELARALALDPKEVF